MLKKIRYNAPVVLTFTFLSLLALILNEITYGYTNSLLFSVYRSSWEDPLTYVRLFTHVLGHANWQHFINNFMFILLIGPILEEKYGGKALVGMILLTAFVTGIINMIFFTTGLLGASGIVFMFILLASFVNTKQRTIPLTFILVAVLYIGNEVLNGLFSRDQVSQLTHIIGGICGSSLGYYLNKK